MKTRVIIPVLALLIAAGQAGSAQTYSANYTQESSAEYLGLPGDNLNLYAVMKLFQESPTLEKFEKELNNPENRINNLDLNADGYVDYIMVNDNVKGKVHYIILRVALNDKENQDVAVFIVRQYSDGSVQIQLIGDEALYGKDYIIEPYMDEEFEGTPNPGYLGERMTVNGRKLRVIRTSPVIISSWPLVSYIYGPDYYPWHSSWYWGYYPSYWNPWRPLYWHYYYGYHYHWYDHYYSFYRHCNHYRWYSDWHDHYYVTRVHSPVVVININNGEYRTTYSRPQSRRDGEEAYYREVPPERRRVTYTSLSTGGSQGRSSGSDNTSVTSRRTAGNTGGSETRVSRPARPSATTSSGAETTELRRSATENSSERREAPTLGSTNTRERISTEVSRRIDTQVNRSQAESATRINEQGERTVVQPVRRSDPEPGRSYEAPARRVEPEQRRTEVQEPVRTEPSRQVQVRQEIRTQEPVREIRTTEPVREVRQETYQRQSVEYQRSEPVREIRRSDPVQEVRQENFQRQQVEFQRSEPRQQRSVESFERRQSSGNEGSSATTERRSVSQESSSRGSEMTGSSGHRTATQSEGQSSGNSRIIK